MKVWMFYLVPENPQCDPILYAFTNHKNRAEEFSAIRQNLTKVVRNLSKEEYRDMYDKLGDQYAIIEERFLTRDENSNICKTSVYVTSGEAMDFRIHLEQIACIVLGLSTNEIPLEIFNEEIANFLREIAMDSTSKIVNSVGNVTPFGFDISDSKIPMLWSGNYKLDELYIFLKYRSYTVIKKG